jgi:transposase InsO family protein
LYGELTAAPQNTELCVGSLEALIDRCTLEICGKARIVIANMSDENRGFNVAKLNGENYHAWKFSMKMYLMGKDLWGIVQRTETLEADATIKQRESFRRRENQALSCICLGILESLHIYVRSCETAAEAWENLQNHFEEKTLARKIQFRRQLYNTKLTKSTTMEAHVNALKTISEHLEALGDHITDDDLVMILLSSLTDDYNHLITTLENLREEQLTWNYVRDRVLSEYSRMVQKGEKKRDDHGALFTRDISNTRRSNQNQKNNPNQQHNDGRHQSRQNLNQNGGRGNGNNQNKLKCHHCKEKGHLRRDCPQINVSGSNSPSASFSRASNFINLNPTCSPEFALKVSSDSVGDDWCVDSGATSHMTPEMDDFQTYTEFKSPLKVRIADKSYLDAPGYGDVCVKLFDAADPNRRQFDVLLKDTLYVPEIGNKLFSIPSVTSNDGSITLEKEACVLTKDEKSVQIGTKVGNLYTLNIVPTNESSYCNIADTGKPLSLWHLRYGHLNSVDVKLLANQNLVDGLTLSSDDSIENCHGCALGKSKRNSFPKKSSHKSTKPLQLVHSDICGPFHVNSVGGSRYFATFIDDFSRYVSIYILKSKDEALEKFMDFVLLAENKFGVKMRDFSLEGELGLKLKKVRTDGGGEYISNNFKEFCRSRGIEKQLTTPYTPQQNGVAERMNRTLVEMARSMMFHADCPEELWAEAVSTAAYIRNRCPTSAFQGATPYERWNGEKPSVDHLRIFGCQVYVHVPDQTRNKLAPKAQKGIFVGYPAGTKGYKIFLPNTRQMVSSRDVQFIENTFSTIDRTREERNTETTENINRTFDRSVDVEIDMPEPLKDDVAILNMEPDHDSDFVELDDPQPDFEVRPQRNRRMPDRYGECVYVADAASWKDPKTYKQALKSSNANNWMKAMEAEYQSLKNHRTWDLVDLPPGANLVGCKWIYKVKLRANGEIDRYIARLVAQGFSQKPGVDFDEVYAPVAKYKSIRTLLAIGNQFDLEIHQMDVVAAYLNGDISEDIYMKQPDGFISKNFPNKVCKLNRSLYGLKQSGRCWNEKIDRYLKSQGYQQSDADPCIYHRTKNVGGRMVLLYIGVYVDDTIFMSNDTATLHSEKAKISEEFSMDDRGEIHFILGMEIRRDRANKILTISQKQYLETVLERFGMSDCNPISTPVETGKRFERLTEDAETVDVKIYQAAIGSLNYAAIATRPDISLAVGLLSQHMVRPGKEHWSGVKRILRYLKGTLDLGLKFEATSSDDFVLHGYSDADWAGCPESRKSTSGQLFKLGNSLISWRSRKQSIVALSTTEAEYVALCDATQESVWLRQLLRDIGHEQRNATTIHEDNQGAIVLSQNPKDHTRTKHIDIKFHFIREKVAGKELEVVYCGTTDMIADALTKGLPKPSFEKFRARMGVHRC